jgi:hypothetical protein
MSKQNTTNFEDIIQVVVGACALSVPVAFSEEAWNLGRTLPVANIIVLVALSLLFVNLYSLHNIFQGRITHRILPFSREPSSITASRCWSWSSCCPPWIICPFSASHGSLSGVSWCFLSPPRWVRLSWIVSTRNRHLMVNPCNRREFLKSTQKEG